MNRWLARRRVFGALSAGLVALSLLMGGVQTGSPWVFACGIAAAGGAVALGTDRWLTGRTWAPRDPAVVLRWQAVLGAVLVVGPLVLLAAFG